MTIVDDKAHYMPGAATFTMKLIADRSTQRLLGVQVAGPGAVDKIVDITVTAIQCGATLTSWTGADFAYAPPLLHRHSSLRPHLKRFEEQAQRGL